MKSSGWRLFLPPQDSHSVLMLSLVPGVSLELGSSPAAPALLLSPNGNTAGSSAPLRTIPWMLGHITGTPPGVPPSLFPCSRMHGRPEGPTAAGGCQNPSSLPAVPPQNPNSAITPRQLWLGVAPEPQSTAVSIPCHPYFEKWHFLVRPRVPHGNSVLQRQAEHLPAVLHYSRSIRPESSRQGTSLGIL